MAETASPGNQKTYYESVHLGFPMRSCLRHDHYKQGCPPRRIAHTTLLPPQVYTRCEPLHHSNKHNEYQVSTITPNQLS